MSKLAFNRKRAPIGGRVVVVLLPDAWRAGHRYFCPPVAASLPQMFTAVKRIAWAISPAATSSQRARPGKIGRPAASAEVKPAVRSALELSGNFTKELAFQLDPPP